MSHEQALLSSFWSEGLNEGAFEKLASHWNNLKNRPDYDGFVTIQEGVDWARTHQDALEKPTPGWYEA